MEGLRGFATSRGWIASGRVHHMVAQLCEALFYSCEWQRRNAHHSHLSLTFFVSNLRSRRKRGFQMPCRWGKANCKTCIGSRIMRLTVIKFLRAFSVTDVRWLSIELEGSLVSSASSFWFWPYRFWFLGSSGSFLFIQPSAGSMQKMQLNSAVSLLSFFLHLLFMFSSECLHVAGFLVCN